MNSGSDLVPLAQTDTTPGEDTLSELSRLTAQDWITAAAILAGAIVVAVLFRMVVVRALRERSGPLVARLLGRLALAGVVAVGVIYALNAVGVSMGPVLGLLGLFGLALALAFQDVLSNFLAGVMLSVRRPFRVGEEIGTSDFEGVVEDVSLRSVTIRTYDGVRVLIPNATVWQGAIENFTTLGARRTSVGLGVSYDADLDHVQELILESIVSVEGVHEDPAPQAYVHEFADSSVNFEVRFWHDPKISEEWKVRDRLARKLKSKLDEAAVEIPFPQLVVHRPQTEET